jgi:hypothetical protein
MDYRLIAGIIILVTAMSVIIGLRVKPNASPSELP